MKVCLIAKTLCNTASYFMVKATHHMKLWLFKYTASQCNRNILLSSSMCLCSLNHF